MTATITHEEWLAELERIAQQAPSSADGMTAAELVESSGKTWKAINNYLHKAIAAGEWECIKVRRTNIVGSAQSVPAYRPKARA